MNTNPIPELAPQLKLLRLSGILDSLESRNRQAIQGKLAYTEFLAMLVSDEVARRENKKFSMRLRRAQFRTTKTLEQFDFERVPALNRALLQDLAAGRLVAPFPDGSEAVGFASHVIVPRDRPASPGAPRSALVLKNA